jgi:hypothetical protein
VVLHPEDEAGGGRGGRARLRRVGFLNLDDDDDDDDDA